MIGAALLLAPASAAVAQQAARLSAGDSIRVDGEIVGRVLSIDDRVVNVVSREAPRCRAGLMHGDPAICDPSPIVRHTVSLDEVTVERRMRKSHFTLRMLAGAGLGAAAFGAIGWVIGPELGFGSVDGCVSTSLNNRCRPGEEAYTQEEYTALQKSADQRMGALFFGLLGGTATAIVVRKLSFGWVRVEPIVTAGPSEPWGLGFTVPTPR